MKIPFWPHHQPPVPMTRPCHCLCQHWGHLGICLADGIVTVRMPNAYHGGPPHVDILMCIPCAKDVELKLLLVSADA